MIKRAILIIATLSLMLTGCGVSHDPSSSTDSTGPTAQVISREYDITASIVREQTNDKYVYTLFVYSDEVYAPVKDDCVMYLDDTYVPITDIYPDVQVDVVNLNHNTTKNVSAFVTITSNTILDTKKIFVSVLGTTEYQTGMEFISVEDYREKYGSETMVSMYIQMGDTPLNVADVYSCEMPLYESIRLINQGDGYDVVFLSTENTKSYTEDDTLWTPVDVKYVTDCNYADNIASIIDNTYCATGTKTGTYKDLNIIHDENLSIVTRNKDGIIEVGIQGINTVEQKPNCVIANVVVNTDETTLSENAAQSAIVLFFN